MRYNSGEKKSPDEWLRERLLQAEDTVPNPETPEEQALRQFMDELWLEFHPECDPFQK